MIGNLRTLALAIALALTTGFVAGYGVKGRFVKADQLDAAIEARHETANDIQESLETSNLVEQNIAASNQQTAVVRKMAAANFKKKESRDAEVQIPAQGSGLVLSRDACGLDLGTVRLLNAARTGSPDLAAAVGDAEGQTPSGLGLPDLVDADIEVAGMYRELAVIHNSLVEYVEGLVVRQAAQ